MFLDEVCPELDKENIRINRWPALTDGQRATLSAYFTETVFPVLTPLAVDPAHPFPYISGLSLNLAVTVRDPEGRTERFARVKVPNNVPRLVRVADEDADDESITFLPIEDLIAAHLSELFTGMEVTEVHAFRVTRNADLEVEEDRDEDLLQALERELARRRFGPPVRLEVVDTMSEHVLELLLRELDVDPHDVVTVPGLLDLTALWQIHGVDRPDLKDEPFRPATNVAFADGETAKSAFATLRDGDVLVHHPYDSFSTSVQRFIEQAAADENVLAIKQTLYRTSGDSPIVDALKDAAAAGKQVVALVEIKARFDEMANIRWARELERSGVHVVYGLVGLKTHCKTCLVVRQEGSHIRRYCHIGTGNYNPKTARLYEDLGVLTADPTIGADLTDLFNSLTGYSRQTAYQSLLVAPYGVRRGIIRRIEDEIEAHREGKAGLRPDQGQLAGGRAGHRRSVPGVAGGGAGRRRGARDLRAAAWPRGVEREHPGPLDPRPLPRALADLPLRGGGRVLDRQRGHDAPQPGPTRRGAAAGDRHEGSHVPARGARLLRRPGDAVLDALPRRLVVALPRAGLRRVSGARPPGRDDVPALPSRARGGVRIVNDQPRDDVLAAGAVLWRPAATGVELAWPQSPGSPASEARGGRAEGSLLTIALVHRPRYDDWSLPKGKLDPGESMEQAAVREIREETGVTARLGPWLCDVRYTVVEGRKLVRYWSAEEVESSDFVPGREIDELRWVTPEAAVDLLSHARDVEVVERFGELGPPTSVVLLVRHAKAGSRQDWRDDDLLRPLSPAGRQQSDELARQLSLFGPDRIVTAPPVRCIDTVVPLAETLGLPIERGAPARRGLLLGRPRRRSGAAVRAGRAARCHRGLQPGRRDPGRGRGGGEGRHPAGGGRPGRRAVEEGEHLGARVPERGARVRGLRPPAGLTESQRSSRRQPCTRPGGATR